MCARGQKTSAAPTAPETAPLAPRTGESGCRVVKAWTAEAARPLARVNVTKPRRPNRSSASRPKIQRKIAAPAQKMTVIFCAGSGALLDRDVAEVHRPGVLGAGADEAVVGPLLEDVGGPPGDAAHGEDGREELDGDPHRVVDRPRVE